jgi:hypothetical protein
VGMDAEHDPLEEPEAPPLPQWLAIGGLAAAFAMVADSAWTGLAALLFFLPALLHRPAPPDDSDGGGGGGGGGQDPPKPPPPHPPLGGLPLPDATPGSWRLRDHAAPPSPAHRGGRERRREHHPQRRRERPLAVPHR